jgi:hypothetical protein
MSYRSLSILVAALSSAPIATAGAQTVYVAPGGVYIGAGPVYVTPAPQAVAPPYVAPYAPPPYAAPPYVAPAPTIGIAPGYDVSPPVYSDTGGSTSRLTMPMGCAGGICRARRITDD